MPRCKPWDALATLLSPHAQSPGGSLLLPSQGISSVSPSCCNAFSTPCPLKHPTVYCLGVWGLHFPKANSQCGWRPEGSFAATPDLSWPFGQELSPGWKTRSWPLKRVILGCFTTPCSTSFWNTQTPVSPLSCKNEEVTLPTKPWCRKGDALPAPSEHFP